MMRKKHDPEEAAERMRKRGLEPLEPYPGAHTPWLCRCLKCAKEVRPTYNNVVNLGRGGCKFCARSNRKHNPDEAAERMRKRGLEPLEPYPSAGTPWLCRCRECAKEVRPTYHHVVNQGRGGCKFCAANNRKLNPDEAADKMRERGLEPLVLYPGASTPWLCRCRECAKEVRPTYDHVVTKGHGGCKFCGYKAQSLTLAQMKEAIDALDGVEAPYLQEDYEREREESRPTRMKVRFQYSCCDKMHTQKYFSVVSNGRRCPSCSLSGFDLTKPGWVYFIVNPDSGIAKIGISNNPDQRLSKHKAQGFSQLVWKSEEMLGSEAEAYEKELLENLKDYNLRDKISKEEVPDGHTESFRLNDLLTLSPEECGGMYSPLFQLQRRITG